VRQKMHDRGGLSPGPRLVRRRDAGQRDVPLTEAIESYAMA
jgi:hypothetical protein